MKLIKIFYLAYNIMANNNKICLEKSTFYIGILIIIVIIYCVAIKIDDVKLVNCSDLITSSIIDIQKKLYKNELLINNKAETASDNNAHKASGSAPPGNSTDIVEERDVRVLNDLLYPPLTRTERPTIDLVLRHAPEFNMPTRDSNDTYRAIAYVINTNKSNIDMGGNSWILFGRQLYKGSSRGEFYMLPVNDTLGRMKVFLQDSMMSGEKIRDIYSLPTTITFNSPFFTEDVYTISEMPKTNYTSQYF